MANAAPQPAVPQWHNSFRKGVLIGNWNEDKHSGKDPLFPSKTPYFQTTTRSTYEGKSDGFSTYREYRLLGPNYQPLPVPSYSRLQKELATLQGGEGANVLFIDNGNVTGNVSLKGLTSTFRAPVDGGRPLTAQRVLAGSAAASRPGTAASSRQLEARPPTGSRPGTSSATPLRRASTAYSQGGASSQTARPATAGSIGLSTRPWTGTVAKLSVTQRDFRPPSASYYRPAPSSHAPLTLTQRRPATLRRAQTAPNGGGLPVIDSMEVIRERALARCPTAERRLINSIGTGNYTSKGLYVDRTQYVYTKPVNTTHPGLRK